jgi:TolB protein
MRKLTFFIIALFLLVTVYSDWSYAQTRLTVQGSGKLYPIAVPQLCAQGGSSAEIAKQIPEVITRNLDLSGYFDVLNANTFIEAPGKCHDAQNFAYSDWSVIGVEGLVKGVVSSNGNGLTVQMYLHDVQRQQIVLGKEYQVADSQWRLVAHRFSNEILKYFTGELGVFGSQIAYSGKVGRFKELFVMDMDGSNIKQLTDEKGLAVSAAWNPQGSALVYTNYLLRQPDLFVFDMSRRRITRITNDVAMNVGAKFTIQGDSMYYAKTAGRSSDIFEITAAGKQIRQITRGNGTIEVSPSFSPDGSQVAFVSNRTGGPQIYVMNSDGSNSRRVSFVSSNYCTSPDWSPRGDKLAFVCRADSGHQLFVSNVDGSSALQLTSYGSNEDPSFAPDGRYLAFATTFGKSNVFNIAMIRADGSNLRQLTSGRIGELDPDWNPVVP